MTSLEEFKGRFRFDPERALHVGVERECFIGNGSEKPVPYAHKVLAALGGLPGFGYELSACQVESKTPAGPIGELPGHLERLDAQLESALAGLGLRAIHREVGPDDMPLDIFNDPDGRYRRITRDMSNEQLLSACRIIGTHVHVGMPDAETAIPVYNHVIRHIDELCAIGDNSQGHRLSIYRAVNPDCHPPLFNGWANFYYYAYVNNCVMDPRRCWTLIRISVHGTIEFRMFGTTPNRSLVEDWARRCHGLCASAMQ